MRSVCCGPSFGCFAYANSRLFVLHTSVSCVSWLCFLPRVSRREGLCARASDDDLTCCGAACKPRTRDRCGDGLGVTTTMPPPDDPFSILGVRMDASVADVKTAYRNLGALHQSIMCLVPAAHPYSTWDSCVIPLVCTRAWIYSEETPPRSESRRRARRGAFQADDKCIFSGTAGSNQARKAGSEDLCSRSGPVPDAGGSGEFPTCLDVGRQLERFVSLRPPGMGQSALWPAWRHGRGTAVGIRAQPGERAADASSGGGRGEGASAAGRREGAVGWLFHALPWLCVGVRHRLESCVSVGANQQSQRQQLEASDKTQMKGARGSEMTRNLLFGWLVRGCTSM